MKKYIIPALSALLLFAAGCTKEDVRSVSDDTGLTFSFTKPAESYVTRADEIATPPEWYVGSLEIYAGVEGVVEKLDPTTDYTMVETNRTYTITVDSDWTGEHAGQTVNFYFVGNDSISAFAGDAFGDNVAGHDELLLTDEDDFRNALTNELAAYDGSDPSRPADDNGKLEFPHIEYTGKNLLDSDTRGLLFSAVIEEVRILGKVEKKGLLTRREARFDIVNPLAADSVFVIHRILVSDASSQAMVFGVGDPAQVTLNKLSHIALPGDSLRYTDWSREADPLTDEPDMAISAFYLYPTVLANNATRIVVEGSLKGGEPSLFIVDASAITGQAIESNKRYILRLNPATVSFTLTVADWDSKDISTPVAEDGELVLSDWGGVADGSNANWSLQNLQYEFTEQTGKTLTFTVTSRTGTDATIIPVVGSTVVPATVENKISTTTYSGYWTTEEYTIGIPAGGVGKINLVLTPRTGEASATITFTRLWGGYADILYFADDGTLQIGQWGDEVTSIDQIAFFQFGSVVGFTADATAWDASEIKFDPTSGSYADYTTIPHFVAADWDAGIRNVSDTAAYHTLANLKLGKGDPCMLVGLTAAQVAAMTEEEFAARNSGWRLPTARENAAFVGGPAAATWDGTTNYNYATSAFDDGEGDVNTVNKGNPYDFFTAGTPGIAAFPVVTSYAPANTQALPVTGFRNVTTGAVTLQSLDGYWWSSTPASATNSHNVPFSALTVRPGYSSAYAHGQAIRCVNPASTEAPEGSKNVELPLPVVPVDPANPLLGSNDIMYLDASGKLAVGRWGDPNVTLANLLYFKFGGVIGFDADDTSDAGWGFDDIKFNPTPLTATDITAYTTDPFDAAQSNALPRVPGFVKKDYDDGVRSVSSADYHTFSNIKAGKGDPCQLIGLTAAQIAGATNAAQLIDLLEKRPAEAKGWRLPTAKENADFVGGPVTSASWDGTTNYNYTTALWNSGQGDANTENMGSPYDYFTAGTPGVAKFPVTANGDILAFSQTLPAAGYRYYTTGVVTSQGTSGLWWSSTPASATDGHSLYFGSNYVRPVNNNAASYGFSVRCVKEGVEAITSLPVVSTAHTPGQADILYFDGSSLAIGKWNAEVTTVGQLAHFKFGGVIGFNNVDAWSFDDIKFNPTPLTSTQITAYSTDPFDAATSNALPRVPGFVSQDYTDGIRDLSGADFHNFANIKAGKGDPCQLIGLTAAQIAGATTPDALLALLNARPAAQKGWRMPTVLENIDFVGGPVTSATWDGVKSYNYRTSAWAGDASSTENMGSPYDFFTAGSPGLAKFPVVANDNPVNSQTLPAAGYRHHMSGVVTYQGTYGLWWSSTPASATGGHYLDFNSNLVSPVISNAYSLGFSVRCVKPAS